MVDPVALPDIDADWLTAALRHGGLACTVDSVEIEYFGDGTAFLGTLARLRPTYADAPDDAPTSLVAKTPTDDPGGRSVARLLNAYHREHLFYERLAPLVDAPVPVCRYNAGDPDTETFLLLLDDLHPAEAGDQVAGADPDQAHAAVEALARFHAPFWGRPRTSELQWVPGLDTAGTADALGDAMAGALPRFVDRFGAGLPDQALHWLERFIPQLGDWRRGLLDRPLTIAHADYRLENLMFSPDGTVTMVDWQLAMYTGGPTDLSFFIGTNLDVDIRRRHEDDLVATYTDTLIASGVAPDAVTHVRDDYENAHLWWMGMLCNNLSSIDTPDERSAALFDAMLTRLYAAAIDADSGRFL